MLADKRAIISDINGIFRENDIPWQFELFSEEEIAGNSRGIAGTVCGHPVAVSGHGKSINGYPSSHVGALTTEYLGICDNERLGGVVSDFTRWCEAHLRACTREPLTAVIITDRWEPSVVRKKAEALYAAGQYLDIRFVIILVTWQGADQVNFKLSNIAIDKYERINVRVLGYEGIKNAILSGHVSPSELNNLQDSNYCRLVLNLNKPALITASNIWAYHPNHYSHTPVSYGGIDYYIFNNWQENELKDHRPKLIAWLERH